MFRSKVTRQLHRLIDWCVDKLSYQQRCDSDLEAVRRCTDTLRFEELPAGQEDRILPLAQQSNQPLRRVA